VKFWHLLFKVLLLQGNRAERAFVGSRMTEGVLLVVVYPIVLLAALRGRRRRHGPPVVFWGTAPLISIKYHQQAIRLYGYPSFSVVDELYFLTARSDFDYTTSELLDSAPLLGRLPQRLKGLLTPYWAFLWALRRCDVFVFYASSLILRPTLLKYRELFFLRVARKRVVMIPYGADVQVISRASNLLYKHTAAMDYPGFVRAEEKTRRELEYLSASADHIVSGVDWVDYMSRWDRLTVGHFAIDTNQWRPTVDGGGRRAREKVVVMHAPNHREIKGTRFLIRACAELAAEGVPIQLDLVEGVPNTVIQERMSDADIVADQFIIGWYAFFAIEAMSMAKPVLCYLRPDLLALHTLYATAADCPLVNTPPLEIKDVLRALVADPDRREELGRRGRAYVEANHSLAAVGAMFDEILRGLG
jgi:glycosyltransferase involved in cell wall biosynthesis